MFVCFFTHQQFLFFIFFFKTKEKIDQGSGYSFFYINITPKKPLLHSLTKVTEFVLAFRVDVCSFWPGSQLTLTAH